MGECIMNIRKIRIMRILLMLALGCIIGFSLLMAVYCIPVDNVKDAQQTADIFRQEGDRPSVIPSLRGSTSDNYTDALMIAEALFDDPQISVLEKAVHVYRRANSESATVDIADYLEGKPMQWVIPYARYWHGFLVILRPLLLILGYADIRMLMCSMQMLAYAAIVASMIIKNKKELVIPFFAVMMTLSPMGTMISMQYFASFAIMALGMLAVLHYDAWLKQGARYFYFFVLAGMLTAYLDFLTYPLVTLCMPLLLAVYLHLDEDHLFWFAAAACVCWGVGYAGFWGLKWLCASVLTGENMIYNALSHTKFHVSASEIESDSRMLALTENLKVVFHPGYLLVYLGSAAACVVHAIRKKCGIRTLFSGGRPLLLLIGLLPFFWWAVTVTHSYLHDLFTYRILAITVFALLGWLASAPSGTMHEQ